MAGLPHKGKYVGTLQKSEVGGSYHTQKPIAPPQSRADHTCTSIVIALE